MKYIIGYSTSGYNAILSFDKMVLIMLARLVDIHLVVYASNYIYIFPTDNSCCYG